MDPSVSWITASVSSLYVMSVRRDHTSFVQSPEISRLSAASTAPVLGKKISAPASPNRPRRCAGAAVPREEGIGAVEHELARLLDGLEEEGPLLRVAKTAQLRAELERSDVPRDLEAVLLHEVEHSAGGGG